MQRREFLKHTGAAAGGLGLIGLGACTTTATSSTTTQDTPETRNKQGEIRVSSDNALTRLQEQVPDSRELIAKAAGVLVFPRVIAAGFGIGGQYGEGLLRRKATIVDYYRLTSVSVGLQIGAQSKAIYFLFMTQEAYDNFRKSEGWAVGADASVAVLKAGADGRLDLTAARGPVLAFVLTNAGLMANLTLEGTKITRLT
ncbi:MAG: twin-arginine translocation pathway signal [Paucimonas sp.]|nr:twin-arginine translocation pathway signal [Paucimonas sp.]